MLSAAVLPWLKATSQCSMRIGLPCTGLWYSQMSPAAKIPGTELSRPAEHSTPPASPSSSPAERASVTSGITPGAHDHHVAVERLAALGDHAAHAPVRALEALELVAAVDLHAVLLEHAVEEAAHLAARTALERHVLHHQDAALHAVRGGERGRDLACRCSCRRSARRARPARRRRGSRRSCRTRAGSGCRRGRRPPRAAGARWRRWPAARCRTRSRPWSTASPRAASLSSFITLVRVSSSMSCSPHHSSGRNSASSLDSLPCR